MIKAVYKTAGKEVNIRYTLEFLSPLSYETWLTYDPYHWVVFHLLLYSKQNGFLTAPTKTGTFSPTAMGPPNLTSLEVSMVNNLVFRIF